MGRWGEGRALENDTAADFVYNVLEAMANEIRSALPELRPELLEYGRDDPDSRTVVTLLELMYVVADHAFRQVLETWCIRGDLLPESAEIQKWKDEFLAFWDAAANPFPCPFGDRQERTEISASFDRLIELREYHDRVAYARS